MATDMALGVLAGLALAACVAAVLWRLAARRQVRFPEAHAAQVALEAVTATLPHLSRGLSPQSASRAAPHLRALLQAPAVALTDDTRLLAFSGAGADHHGTGDPAEPLFDPRHPDRVHVEAHLRCSNAECPLGAAIVAPLVVSGEHIGSFVAFYASGARVARADTRAVAEVATLVSTQVALAELEAQAERLAQAELRALRAQISPHFIYNALAAVASHIHTRPEEARELLTDFAEFIRYAFRGQRPYVTLADELRYVEKYLRLEQARFGDRLSVRIDVAPAARQATVPVLSLQPLVENAVRHGVEAAGGRARVEITGRTRGGDVELRVRDDGPGIGDVEAALGGAGGGIGLSNVQARLRQTFGDGYGLRIDAPPGAGTTVTMIVPKAPPEMPPP